MEAVEKISKAEQKIAIESYDALASVIEQLKSNDSEIEIEETGEKIKIPIKALKFLGEMLKAMSKGKFISLVPRCNRSNHQKRRRIVRLLQASPGKITRGR
ncbi:hypothetical protein [Niabella soli]|uniref:hypothetical protein n=1 Tax=Niabella soli TaxID=446683 RepID=UPI0002499C5C|nr:hypothetical protein [Niabella soli]